MAYQLRITIHHTLGVFSGLYFHDEMDISYEDCWNHLHELNNNLANDSVVNITIRGDSGEALSFNKKILSESVVVLNVEGEGTLFSKKAGTYMVPFIDSETV